MSRGREQRELFRRWPAGVSVVVAESAAAGPGLTVSSLVSLSLEPPLVGHLARARGLALRGAAGGGRMGGVDPLAASRSTSPSISPAACRRSCSGTGSSVREDDPRLLAGAVGWLIARTVERVAHGRPHALRRRGRSIERGPPRTSLVYMRPQGTSPCDRRRRLRHGRGARSTPSRCGTTSARSYARERGGTYTERRTRDMMGMSSPEWSRYMHETVGVPEHAAGDQPHRRRADARALRRRRRRGSTARSTRCAHGRGALRRSGSRRRRTAS